MSVFTILLFTILLYDIYSVAHLYHNNSHLNPMEPQQHVHLHAEQAVAHLLNLNYSHHASDPNKCTGINVCNTESVTDNILAFTESVLACTITTSTTSPTIFSVREGHAIIAYLFLFIFKFF